jgi:nicotinic acid mononucleotide adenylyltransferase
VAHDIEKLAGAACTASLASDRPKLGGHRIHVALQTAAITAVWTLPLLKGRRTRAEEERLAGRLVLNVLAEACGVPQQLSLDLLEGEQLQHDRVAAPQTWQDLLSGKIESVRIGPAAERDSAAVQLLFPGAFHPLHAGHRGMVRAAREILQQTAAFEMSILNVDKPPLDYMEIAGRLAQFTADETIVLSRAATFEEKSRLFPGTTFLVGADTIRRIADPKYYGGNAPARTKVIDQIADRGCRFLVFGRLKGEVFVRLGDLDLPEGLRSLCREVPPEVFREDISSTEIRRAGMNAEPIQG